MSVNFGFLAAHLAAVLLLAMALLAVKFMVLFAIGMTSRYGVRSSLFFASAISQGGEFAFVIFNIAAGVRLLPAEIADLLVLTVILSMALTPLLMYAVDRLLAVRPERGTGPIDIAVPEDNQVIIAGFGRYGQIVGRILRAKKIGFTALEISQEQIDFVTKFGAKVYYGDASRPDVLRAARADKAVALVLAIDDVEASLRLAATVKAEFPNLTVLARARNRQHAHRLMDTGVAAINRETLLSSLDTARRLLEVLGLPDYQAARIVETFRRSDEKRFLDEHELIGDEKKLIEDANLWARELEQIFEQDIASEQGGRGRGETPPASREAVRRRR
jgi:voltage-gated potassium channel Kch